jgi:hypothetical protein
LRTWDRSIIAALCVGLAGCTAPTPSTDPTEGPRTETVYLIQRGWHTDIGMAADQLGSSLGRLRSVFPGVKVVLFGFGERAYLLRREPGFTDMLAALIPGPGVDGNRHRHRVTPAQKRTPLSLDANRTGSV